MRRSLEARYRRLLAWYPSAHRDIYEEEMVGVLLDGARPGQRRPGFAESVNILGSAVRARIGNESLGLADDRWRAAAGVVGVLLPMVLALKDLRPITISLVNALRIGENVLPVSSTTWTLAAVWTTTAVFALLGLRWPARIAVWVSLITEIGLLATVYLYDPVGVLHSAWIVVVGFTAAICLTVANPVDRRFLLSRAGRSFGLAALAALAAFAANPAMTPVILFGDGTPGVAVWIYMPVRNDLITLLGLDSLPALVLAVLVVLLAVVGVIRLDPPTRRRLLAMLAPPAVLVLVINQLYAGYVYSSLRFNPPVLMVTGQWIGLVAVPLITFVVAAALVHRRERTVELVALGRQARRSSAPPSEGTA